MKREKQTKESQIRATAARLAVERDSENVEAFCRESFGVSQAAAKALVKEARARLALAADVDVREELGRRKEQLEDLRERARSSGDLRVELAAIQELSKLCDLYGSAAVSNAASDSESAAVSLARGHLEGLALTQKGLPIEELARQIALLIMNGQTELRKNQSAGARSQRA